MSDGPLIDLVSRGAQDIGLISKNLDDTLFKESYTKHTNFSRGSDSINYKGGGNWDSTIKFTIPKDKGDLLSSLYLNIKIPKISTSMLKNTDLDASNYRIRWSDYLGNAIIDRICLKIDGEEIVEQYGQYMQIHTDLYDDDWNKIRMIGHDNNLNIPKTTHYSEELYIPLKFWFSDDPSKALPLVALHKNVNIDLEVKFRHFDQCYSVLKRVNDDSSSRKIHIHTNELIHKQNLENISLEVNYVYLSADERLNIAKNKHKYLIHQVQRREKDISGDINLELNLNNPVKELIFFIQPNRNINEGEIFNFSNKLTYLPAEYSNLTSYNLQEYNELTKYHFLDQAKITFNGIDRVKWKNYKYYYLVQNYEHFRNSSEHYVYIYSFSMYPISNNPSGSCNMSRIENQILHTKLKTIPTETISANNGGTTVSINDSISPSNPGKIVLYATNYNYLIIENGRVGIEFHQ